MRRIACAARVRCADPGATPAPPDPTRPLRRRAARPQRDAPPEQQQPPQQPPQPPPAGGDGAGGRGAAAPPDDPATSAARLAAAAVASPVFYLVAGLAAIKLVASTGEQSLTIFLFAVGWGAGQALSRCCLGAVCVSGGGGVSLARPPPLGEIPQAGAARLPGGGRPRP